MPGKDKTSSSIIRLQRGSLYLSAQACQRYFAGLEAVILLRREDHLYILPVRNTAGGGYLLKLRNSAGDRIINAMDFFRRHGMDDFEERIFDVCWDQDTMALKAVDLFKTVN